MVHLFLATPRGTESLDLPASATCAALKHALEARPQPNAAARPRCVVEMALSQRSRRARALRLREAVSLLHSRAPAEQLKHGLPAHHQRLTYHGALPDDAATLEEAGVREGETLCVSLRVRGALPCTPSPPVKREALTLRRRRHDDQGQDADGQGD